MAARKTAKRPQKKKAAPTKTAKRPLQKKKAIAKATPAKRPPPKKKKKKAAAAPKTAKRPLKVKTKRPAIPPPTPSERALATISAIPEERSLTDEEREAMTKVSETAKKFISANGKPPDVVSRIARFLEEVRGGRRDEPKSQDVRLGLGVLWGDQVRAQVGWRWVHLTYPDGFASYALVPDDRAFACFPLNRLPEALRGSGTNTSARVFDSIRENALPTRKANAYLVIG